MRHKLTGRFDANSYVVLTEAMNSHDVGRGRGGVAQRPAAPTVAALHGDRQGRAPTACYPLRLSVGLADGRGQDGHRVGP
jgi:homoserine O-acetyltransferase